MLILDKFDIRTLLACQMVLSFIFALVFIVMRFAYRKMRGIGLVAFGFLLSAPGVLLLTLRGSVSAFFSVIIANVLILSGYLLLYLGILAFYNVRDRPAAVWASCLSVVAAVLAITWYSTVQDNAVARVASISLCCGFLCALAGVELLRNSAGRFTLRLFAGFMFLHAIISFIRAIAISWSGAPANFINAGKLQALAMLTNLIFLAFLGIFFQIMIAGELTQALEDRARHDLLTGTLNRLGIEERLCTELDRASRNHHPLSAVLIDIDRFKSINDTGGHAAGDAALRAVAQGISKRLRSYDLLGRYGGDEFLLLLPETSAYRALEVVERIRAVLANSGQILPTGAMPTISIGVAEIEFGDTPTTLIARADAALYDAKNAGRNCVRQRSGVRPAVEQELARPVLAASLETP